MTALSGLVGSSSPKARPTSFSYRPASPNDTPANAGDWTLSITIFVIMRLSLFLSQIQIHQVMGQSAYRHSSCLAESPPYASDRPVHCQGSALQMLAYPFLGRGLPYLGSPRSRPLTSSQSLPGCGSPSIDGPECGCVPHRTPHRPAGGGSVRPKFVFLNRRKNRDTNPQRFDSSG